MTKPTSPIMTSANITVMTIAPLVQFTKGIVCNIVVAFMFSRANLPEEPLGFNDINQVLLSFGIDCFFMPLTSLLLAGTLINCDFFIRAFVAYTIWSFKFVYILIFRCSGFGRLLF
jgi:hypothetical protein